MTAMTDALLLVSVLGAIVIAVAVDLAVLLGWFVRRWR
jgi:multisubunit Na+/H+ antiporter MnhC subunit